ncbi:MAG: hypothetical protein OEY33_06285 [Bdellovibrionales bacterium]|nr:hypothetical protein [Bdellovibrionales bacterium]
MILFFLALSFNLGANEQSLQAKQIIQKLKDLEIIDDQFDPSNEEHLKNVEKNIKSKLIKGDQKLIKELSSFLPMLNKGKGENEIKQALLDRLGDGPVKDLLKKYPKLLSFYAQIVKDEKALVALSGVLGQKQKLAYSGIFILLTIFLNYVIKKTIKGIFNQFLRVIFFIVLRIGGVIYIFRDELSPTIKIFREVFLV